MRRGIWSVSFLLLLFFSGRSCIAALSAANAQSRLSSPTNPLAGADNRFGFALLPKLIASQPGHNLFVSPLSATLALGMVYDGARGTTASAMAKALQLGGLSPAGMRSAARGLLASLRSADPHVQLELADSVWMRQGVPFRASFLKYARTYYSATARTLDFTAPSAPSTINEWVSRSTHGKITKMITSIPPNMVFYLLNAVYFNGQWTVAFDPKKTASGTFTTSSGAQLRIPFMNRSGGFDFAFKPDARIVSLPYGSGRFSMVVAMPTGSTTVGELAGKLDQATWDDWTSSLHEAGNDWRLWLPRFSRASTFNFNGPLAKLGMGAAFRPGADLSGLCTGTCFISEVKQKTYLKVNEHGTEAAAATDVGGSNWFIPPPIVIDHPFLLVIHDAQTGSILFIGVVDDPSR